MIVYGWPQIWSQKIEIGASHILLVQICIRCALCGSILIGSPVSSADCLNGLPQWEPENADLHERLQSIQRERNTLRSERARLLALVAALQGGKEAAAMPDADPDQPRPPPTSGGSYASAHGSERRQSSNSLPVSP